MLEFKEEKHRMLFTLLNPILIQIYAELYNYAKEKHGINLVITDTVSTKERDKVLGRVSDSHRTFRAMDIRAKDIDAFVLQDIINYINTRWHFKKYHYMSRSGVKRLAFLHTTNAPHIHLAIHKKFESVRQFDTYKDLEDFYRIKI
jgi:hypothetical protein